MDAHTHPQTPPTLVELAHLQGNAPAPGGKPLQLFRPRLLLRRPASTLGSYPLDSDGI